MDRDVHINQWHGCYEGGWQDMIVPEAFVHPAKIAYSLLIRILTHVYIQDWIKPGSTILDPFGGISTTGILGAYNGYRVVTVELEEKFCRLAKGYDCPGITKKEWVRWYGRFERNPYLCPKCLGNVQHWYVSDSGIIPEKEAHRFIGNVDLHARKWDALGSPYPVIIQGDSRNLCQLLSECDCIVGSPPYAQLGITIKGHGIKGANVTNDKNYGSAEYGQTPGQLGAMKPGSIDTGVSSPPYAESLKGDGTQKETAAESRAKRRTEGGSLGQSQRTQGYGSNGNLGNLKPGDIDCVLGSPPYATGSIAKNSPGIDRKKQWETYRSQGGGLSYKAFCKQQDKHSHEYGNTEGQLQNLKPGDIDMICSSPPYLDPSCGRTPEKTDWSKCGGIGNHCGRGPQCNEDNMYRSRNDTTFWQAAQEIVQQCYQVLKPGGHAIWVTKRFVRKGKIVEFSKDWARLCESVGFKLVCWHKAMLVKETKSIGLFGQTIIDRKESKSFFRRLADRKAAQKSYWKILDDSEQKYWINYATEKAWDHYNSLTKEEKAEYVIDDQPDSGPKYPMPCEASIESAAKFYALEMSDDDPNQYNEHVRIDWEDVMCLEKE